MKVVVDHELCEGNGRCAEAAPRVFALGGDDLSHVLLEHPPDELSGAVARAINLCPRQAIHLIED